MALTACAVCASDCQSELAALVAWVLLEKRNLEGMVGRGGMRRDRRLREGSLISVRGERGWLSMSSAWLLAAAVGSMRRRTTRLNMVVVVEGPFRVEAVLLSSQLLRKVGSVQDLVQGMSR